MSEAKITNEKKRFKDMCQTSRNITCLIITVCFVILIGCQQKKSFPEIAFPPNGIKQIQIDEASTRIVSKDVKETVNLDDIRVKRVKYLLSELRKEESLSLYDSCNLVEASTKILEDKHGVKITMQEFLEEMKKAKDLQIPESLNQKSNFMTLASIVAAKKGR